MPFVFVYFGKGINVFVGKAKFLFEQGDAVAALAGVLCSLALLGGAVYLYVQTRGGALVIFAALALLLSALKELRLARRAIKV